jgi:hypothetical protein
LPCTRNKSVRGRARSCYDRIQVVRIFRKFVATALGFGIAGLNLVAIDFNVVATGRNVVATDLNFMATDWNVIATDRNVVPTELNVVPADLNVAAIELDVVPAALSVAATGLEPVAPTPRMVPPTFCVVEDVRNAIAAGFFRLRPDVGKTPPLRIRRPDRVFSLPTGSELSQLGRVSLRLGLAEARSCRPAIQLGFVCARSA